MTQFMYFHLAFFIRFPSSPERQATFHPHAHTARNVTTVSLQTKWKMENFLFQTHISQKRYYPGTYFSCVTLRPCGVIQQRTVGLLYFTISVCNSDHVASILGLLVRNEMEINWKQAVVASSKYYPEIFMDILGKTMKHIITISDIPIEILAVYLAHTSRGSSLQKPDRCVFSVIYSENGYFQGHIQPY